MHIYFILQYKGVNQQNMQGNLSIGQFNIQLVYGFFELQRNFLRGFQENVQGWVTRLLTTQML